MDLNVKEILEVINKGNFKSREEVKELKALLRKNILKISIVDYINANKILDVALFDPYLV